MRKDFLVYNFVHGVIANQKEEGKNNGKRYNKWKHIYKGGDTFKMKKQKKKYLSSRKELRREGHLHREQQHRSIKEEK